MKCNLSELHFVQNDQCLIVQVFCIVKNTYVCINLHNVTGESIECYICNSQLNSKCADPIQTSGLDAVQCTKPALEEASSAVKDGLKTLGNILGFQGIPEGTNSDLKFACQKIDMSGKRL